MTLHISLRQNRHRKPRLLRILVGMLVLLVGQGGSRCFAHPGNIAAALAKVQPNGAFEVRLRFDLLAYTLSELPNRISDAPMNALLDGSSTELESRLAETKERFRQNFRVAGCGPEVIDKMTFPDAAEVLRSVKGVRMRLPVMASVTVTGHLPPRAKTISFRFDEVLGAIVLTTEFPYQEPVSEPIDAGAFSSEQRIPTQESVDRAADDYQKSVPAAEKTPAGSPKPDGAGEQSGKQVSPLNTFATKAVKPLVAKTTPTPPPAAPPHAIKPVVPSPVAPSPPAIKPANAPHDPSQAKPRESAPPTPATMAVTPVSRNYSAPFDSDSTPNRVQGQDDATWLRHFAQYIKMGFTHILPEGIDHILFVLGLFLLSTRMKTLLQQITAFTVAHSLTLALSLYGVVYLPASFVEPVIAASIVFVAVENLFTTEMKAWRPALVFGFGLIHGLGFATALQSAGLRHEDLLNALLGFNVGVELGQLTVVALAFLVVGRFRNHPDYRKFVVVPGSIAIAATALYWTFQRIL